MNEQQAIQRLKQGDIGGLEHLVTKLQLKAIRVSYLITRDLGLAEDVVQDTFLKIFRAIHGFDATYPFEPWFLRSVINASVKVARKSARQIDFDATRESKESQFAELISRVESVEERVESIELQNQVWDAMEKLSPRQRAVIVQRYFLEMSEKEMAAESGAAVGTIKWLLSAARQRLKTLLAERSDQ